MPYASRDRSRDRRRWTLVLAYAALLASCDSPFAPEVVEVGRLDVTPPVLTMVVGGEATLVARAYDASDNLLPTAKVFWSTQDPTVVSITQTGVATAVGAGTAQLAASSGGKSRTIAVTVSPRPIALVRITPPAANVVHGQTLSLLGEAIDGTGNVLPGRVLEWTTSEPAIATVNASGVVTGISLGQATISAAGEGKVGTAIVTVVPAPVVSISVAPDGGSLPAGGTLPLIATPRDANGTPLTGRTLQWRSSNDAVATVSGTGLLTAISPGTVTITVSAPGAGPDGSTPSTSVSVTVLIEPVATAVIVPSPIGIQIAQTTNLTLNLFAAGGAPLSSAGRTIAWLSSDPSVVTVNDAGAITGVSVGVATVTATITTPGQATPVQASTQVNVNNRPVASVVVTPNPAVVHAGYARTLTATALDNTGQPLPGRVMVFTSSNQGIASVDAVTGVVAGLIPGSAQVTATAEGIQGVADIVVDLVAVGSVTMLPASHSMLPAQTHQFSAVPRDSAGTALQAVALGNRPTTWNSSNSAAATVNSSGLVTAVAPGTTEISAMIGGAIGRAMVTVTALPSATQLAIVTQPPATASNDVAFSVQPAVQLKDALGNNVLSAGVTVSAAITAPGQGVLGGATSAVTDASGVATFSNLKITGLVGSRTLTFSSGALTPVTSSSINLQAGTATQLVMVTPPPATANSGQVFSSPTVLQLRDVSGNTVPTNGALVSASVSPSAGMTLGGSSTTTTGGTATFGALTLTGPAGAYSLTFTTGALPPVSSGAITLGAGSGSKLSITTQPSATAQSGQVFGQQPVIQLRDGSDNPVAQAGVIVSAAILSGGGSLGGTTTATTNLSGQATFTNLSISGSAGNRTLLFGASGFTAVTSSAINVTAGVPAVLQITTQPPATATNGAPLSTAPVVRVTDAASNGVVGVSVTAAIASGGGAISGGTVAVTDASGNATFAGLTITGLVGSKTLSFTAGALSANSSAIQLTAGPAASLTVSTAPTGSVPNDVVFPQQPVIQLLDASGNGVPNVTVTAAITAGGGTLGGTAQATSNATGFASFAGLKITGTPGPRTLGFSSGSLTPVSAGVTITVGAPALLTVTTAPQSPVANDAVFAPQPAVTVADISGTPVPGVSVGVAITAGGGTLGGTPGATSDASGVATFAGLKITGTIGARTLTFTAGSLTATANVNVTAGAATQLALTTPPPASVANGATFSAVVQLRDVSGNNVTGPSVSVGVAMTSGGGTFTATTPVATDGSGAAPFSDLKITGLVGVRQLTFSAGALAPAVASVNLAAGAAASLTVSTPPTASVPNDVAFPQQPVIRVQDASTNPVPNVTVTASISAGGGTLGGTVQATSDANGFATFSGLKITGTPGARTLGFSSGVLTPASAGVTITVGAPAVLTVTTAPQSPVANDAVMAPQPAVTVTDISGTPIAGLSVGVAITAGGGTLGGTPSATTDALGVATFAGLKITGTIGARTLTFTAGSLTATANVNVTAGAATQIALTTPPPATVANGTPFSAVVQLRDVSGNNATGPITSVGVGMTSGGGNFTATTPVSTDGNGAAAFSDLQITGLVGARQLTFSGGAFASVVASVNLTAGAAASLNLATPPSASVQNDLAFGQQPVVQVLDASGNGVPNVTVNAAITAGGGALGGSTQAVTSASGVATFGDLKITGTVGLRTLTFSAGALSANANVNVTPGTPSQLVFTSAPPGGVADGQTFSAALQLRDVSGNAITTAGTNVNASLTGGSGALSGTTTQATDASGVAQFGDLAISGTGPHVLTFAAAGLTAQANISVSFFSHELQPESSLLADDDGVRQHTAAEAFVTLDSSRLPSGNKDGTTGADLNTSVLVWNHSRGRRA